MKTKILILLTIIPFLTACNFSSRKGNSNGGQKSTNGPVKDGVVVEGVINGGGGKGVLCTKDGVSKLEVLDIYEGRSLYGQTYENLEKKNLNQLFVDFDQLVKKHFENNIYDEPEEEKENFLSEVLRDAKFTKSGQSLKSTNDSDEPFIEKNCELVQIAVYYDEAVLLIDKDYWDMLSDFDKMALLSHEMVYAYKRRSGESNSISSRRFVSHLLSDAGLTPKYGAESLELSQNQILYCMNYEDYKLSFTMFEVEEGIKVVLNDVSGETLWFHTSGIIKGKKIDDFLPPVSQQGNSWVELNTETSSLPFGNLGIDTWQDQGTFNISLLNMKRGQESIVDHKVICQRADGTSKVPERIREQLKQDFVGQTLSHLMNDFEPHHTIKRTLVFNEDVSQYRKTVEILDADKNLICGVSEVLEANFNFWSVIEDGVQKSDFNKFYLSGVVIESADIGDKSKELYQGTSCGEYVSSYTTYSADSIYIIEIIDSNTLLYGADTYFLKN